MHLYIYIYKYTFTIYVYYKTQNMRRIIVCSMNKWHFQGWLFQVCKDVDQMIRGESEIMG